MAHAQQMLDTYPGDFGLDGGRLAEAIEALIDCANTCTLCADACLSESNTAELGTCIRLNLDCADVCMTTSRVVSRQTGYDTGVTRTLLEACIAVCRSCADECGGHAEMMEHCRICAEQCRRCEEACRDLLSSMS